MSIVLAVAVALAPLWITMTHGPNALLAAAEQMVEASALDAAHGHVHADQASQPGHDPSDHDHQAVAWIPQTVSTIMPRPDLQPRLPIIAMAMEPEEPERPPRAA